MNIINHINFIPCTEGNHRAMTDSMSYIFQDSSCNPVFHAIVGTGFINVSPDASHNKTSMSDIAKFTASLFDANKFYEKYKFI